MPTYEYACTACGHRFEEFQSIKADPIKKCPKCQKNKVQRLISGGAGFIFKGSGFYITDYRSDSYKNAAKADTSSSSSAPSSSTNSSSSSSASSTSTPKETSTKSSGSKSTKSGGKPSAAA